MSPEMQKRVVAFAADVLKAFPPGTDTGHELSPVYQLVVIANVVLADEKAEEDAKAKEPDPYGNRKKRMFDVD